MRTLFGDQSFHSEMTSWQPNLNFVYQKLFETFWWESVEFRIGVFREKLGTTSWKFYWQHRIFLLNILGRWRDKIVDTAIYQSRTNLWLTAQSVDLNWSIRLTPRLPLLYDHLSVRKNQSNYVRFVLRIHFRQHYGTESLRSLNRQWMVPLARKSTHLCFIPHNPLKESSTSKERPI